MKFCTVSTSSHVHSWEFPSPSLCPCLQRGEYPVSRSQLEQDGEMSSSRHVDIPFLLPHLGIAYSTGFQLQRSSSLFAISVTGTIYLLVCTSTFRVFVSRAAFFASWSGISFPLFSLCPGFRRVSACVLFSSKALVA